MLIVMVVQLVFCKTSHTAALLPRLLEHFFPAGTSPFRNEMFPRKGLRANGSQMCPYEDCEPHQSDAKETDP